MIFFSHKLFLSHKLSHHSVFIEYFLGDFKLKTEYSPQNITKNKKTRIRKNGFGVGDIFLKNIKNPSILHQALQDILLACRA